MMSRAINTTCGGCRARSSERRRAPSNQRGPDRTSSAYSTAWLAPGLDRASHRRQQRRGHRLPAARRESDRPSISGGVAEQQPRVLGDDLEVAAVRVDHEHQIRQRVDDGADAVLAAASPPCARPRAASSSAACCATSACSRTCSVTSRWMPKWPMMRRSSSYRQM